MENIIKIIIHIGNDQLEIGYIRINTSEIMEDLPKRIIKMTKEELERNGRRTILEMEFVYNNPLTKDNRKNLEMEIRRKPKNLTDRTEGPKRSARLYSVSMQCEFEERYVAKLLAKEKTNYIRNWNSQAIVNLETTRKMIMVKSHASNIRKVIMKKWKSENQKEREKLRSKKQRREKRMKAKMETMSKDEKLESEIRNVIDQREIIEMKLQTEKFLDEREKLDYIEMERRENLIPRIGMSEKDLIMER